MSSVVLDLNFTKNVVEKKWLYKDTNINFTNKLEKTDLSAIQNSINNLFIFRKGERILKPEYGNVLVHFLYEPINNLSEKRFREDLRKMFEDWEPRLEIEYLEIEGFPDEHRYNIKINYSIPSLEEYNLVFEKNFSK